MLAVRSPVPVSDGHLALTPKRTFHTEKKKKKVRDVGTWAHAVPGRMEMVPFGPHPVHNLHTLP